MSVFYCHTEWTPFRLLLGIYVFRVEGDKVLSKAADTKCCRIIQRSVLGWRWAFRKVLNRSYPPVSMHIVNPNPGRKMWPVRVE
jgi:hypothetical protein